MVHHIYITIGVVISSAILAAYLYKKKKSYVKTLVDPTQKVKLPLIEKEIVSHDTRRFRFALPSSNHILGLPIGQHIFLSATIDEESTIRSYTPVSSDDDLGFMDLVIKVYFENTHPKFPNGGKMSQHLESLKIGDTIDIRGPAGRIKYHDHGNFSIKLLRKEPSKVINVKKVCLIAGGTGITPMLQLIRHIIKNPYDKTQVALLFANQTEKDILLRNELEEIQQKFPNRFKLWYTIDVPSEGWIYSTGFISQDIIKKSLFPPSNDVVVFMCGPPPMINFACMPHLKDLGYDPDMLFAY